MKRFRFLLLNEFKLFRTTIPIHIIGFFQPTLMFSLMALILITPTFDMRVVRPAASIEQELVSAMQEVGSPIGEKYISPVLVDPIPSGNFSGAQIIVFESRDEKPTAVQRFGLIDSNIVKNYRNRLTAAALVLWDKSLGEYSLSLEQKPWLPHDVPYTVYFGMAMLPLAAFLSASLIGAFLAAQEFEFNTITEYRLSPVSMSWILGARLVRLSITGAISSLFLILAVGLVSGFWPSSWVSAVLILLTMAFLGGCLGTTAGLFLQSTLPAFVINLAASFFVWILGGAFGLPAGFGGAYEAISRWMPNTYAVNLLFPLYYRIGIGTNRAAVIFLTSACIIMVLMTTFTYRQKVVSQQRVLK